MIHWLGEPLRGRHPFTADPKITVEEYAASFGTTLRNHNATSSCIPAPLLEYPFLSAQRCSNRALCKGCAKLQLRAGRPASV